MKSGHYTCTEVKGANGLRHTGSMTSCKPSGDQAWVPLSQIWATQLLEQMQAYVKGTPPQLIKGQLAKLVAKRSRATPPWHEARIVSLNHSITWPPEIEPTNQDIDHLPLPNVPLFGFKTESANLVGVLPSWWNWVPACRNLFNKCCLLLHSIWVWGINFR